MSIIRFLIFCVGICISTASSAESLSQPIRQFRVFDALLFANKPSLAGYGITTLPAVDRFFSRGVDISKPPSLATIKELSQRVLSRKRSICFLDIETWPKKEAEGDWRRGLEQYLQTFRQFKALTPGVTVGYYGLPPVMDYWRAIQNPTSKKYLEWQRDNDRLIPLAKEVDALFPSLYTFYPDQNGWVRFAKANIREAKRYEGNKPVYPFLWPQYHESNKLMSGQYIDRDYWRLQLNTVKQNADGLVLWGGWDLKKKKPLQWDENAAWWIETKKFVEELNRR